MMQRLYAVRRVFIVTKRRKKVHTFFKMASLQMCTQNKNVNATDRETKKN